MNLLDLSASSSVFFYLFFFIRIILNDKLNLILHLTDFDDVARSL